MRLYFLAVVAFFFCLIQASVIFSIRILDVIPNLIIIILIYIALFYGWVAMYFGFFMGLFQDFYSTSNLGYNTLINTNIGYLLGILSSYIYKDNVFFQAVIIFGISLLTSFLLSLFGRELSIFNFWRYIVPSSLYTTVIGVPIFLLLRKWEMRK